MTHITHVPKALLKKMKTDLAGRTYKVNVDRKNDGHAETGSTAFKLLNKR
jgi:hypothetical protein